MSILPLALRAVREGQASPALEQLKELTAPGERPYIVAVDFDGTICEDRWPDIGPENRPLTEVLFLLKRLGVLLVLWSCREGDDLDRALEWCAARGLVFDAVNENCQCVIDLFDWNTRKVHADEYWDDRAVTICCGAEEELS